VESLEYHKGLNNLNVLRVSLLRKQKLLLYVGNEEPPAWATKNPLRGQRRTPCVGNEEKSEDKDLHPKAGIVTILFPLSKVESTS
jgi:hypothetical protein